jgi:SAM-dependent methyltransferase
MDSARTPCGVCSATEYRDYCEKEGHRYVKCAGCGVLRQHPYPAADEITDYYERYATRKSASTPYLTPAGFELLERDKRFTFDDLGLSWDDFADKRVCDVGCATGQFLTLLSNAATPEHVFGIDMSPECIEVAREHGFDCVVGDFLDVDQNFDVIFMWHIVEHLPRPRDYIAHAASLLALGGRLLVETPATGVLSDAFGADWRFLMPVEHVNLFAPDALFRLCLDHGFALESFVRFGSGNTSGLLPPANKRAMDAVAKRLGIGDTLAASFVRRA